MPFLGFVAMPFPLYPEVNQVKKTGQECYEGSEYKIVRHTMYSDSFHTIDILSPYN